MEIVLAALSWLVTILLPLLVLSVPVSFVIEKTVDTWKGSKGAGIYKTVQLISLGVFLVGLMVVVVLMLV